MSARRIAFLYPGSLSVGGYTTHITELWKRLPEKLGRSVTLLLLPSQEGFTFPYTEGLTVTEAPVFFTGKKIPVLSKLLYQLWAFVHLLVLADLAVVYDRYATLNLAGPLAAFLRRRPLVVEVNGLVADEKKPAGFSQLIVALHDLLARWLFSRAATIIAVSEGLARAITHRYGADPKKITVIPNGVDTDTFTPADKTAARNKLDLPADKNILCYAGAFRAHQHLDALVPFLAALVKKNHDVLLVLAGDGPNRHHIQRSFHAAGLSDHVRFEGWVDYENIPDYLAAADLCLAPFAPNRLASPLKIYEYLACGRPVVAWRIEDIDFIEEHGLGLLVDDADLENAAESTAQLLANPVKQDTMRAHARDYAIRHATWDFVAQKTATLLTTVSRH